MSQRKMREDLRRILYKVDQTAAEVIADLLTPIPNGKEGILLILG